MLHEPPPKLEQDHASGVKARIGLILFGIYSLIYVGFIVLNTAAPTMMGQVVVLGLNLAVIYGFGLIALAVNMGLVYHVVCNRLEARLNAQGEDADHDL